MGQLRRAFLANYLVTGCAGFIGSKVCELLLSADHTVLGIDNLCDTPDLSLKHWRLEQITSHRNFTFSKIDVRNRDDLESVFASQNTQEEVSLAGVINLAARAGVRQSVENPWVYFETNVTGTLNLLHLCQKYNVQNFVLASTSSLYGKHNTMPYREDAVTDQPLSPYAASKKAAEALCYTYHFLYDINTTILRYFTVYGPGGRPDMAPFRFVQWISEERPLVLFGDGSQQRDFTYIDDIARATVKSLDLTGYDVINVGSDNPVKVLDFIHLIEEKVGKHANIEFQKRHAADALATWADISKAERVLNWRPRYEINEGLQELVDWYNANRSWAREIFTL